MTAQRRLATPPGPIIELRHVFKTYGTGHAATHALHDASLTIAPGSFTVIVGPSGSGKSTVLNLIGLLDRPSGGEYLLDGRPVADLRTDNDRARVRRELIGFIFQQFNLLQKASALENVMVPGIYSHRRDRRQRAETLLRHIGLGHRLSHRPNQLSGGEQQRVAIARALLNDPRVLLADEPTGNLDTKTGAQVLGLLRDLNQAGKTLVVVTHDSSIAKQADTVIEMKDGKVVR